MPPFQYEAQGRKRAVMPYRQMPERLYDDPDELAQWATRALAAAHRQKRSPGKNGAAAAAMSRSKTK